ncbi:ABC transporter ATP-binding protein [Antarcticimicrobium sediminis]|uniref:ABC transporter ATP-binding protein n=1 Tax=Antarcticimicrobium sediminis TaxID=2546227 RepID=A0A4R5EMU8_9RHOB|nr:ABC transporter ATP-binding protein [Antarcticimicrobium sediminis]TDE35912.1 ABC transporter ATP-binding protein [Antarcticimicrobium sediminis]
MTTLSTSGPLLDVRAISLRFGKSDTNLLQGVRYSVDAGETLCIVGESGCGKSVSSLAIMGLLPAGAVTIDEADVQFRGVPLDLHDTKAMRRFRGSDIAMIFQEPMSSLNPAFRIGNQIAEAVTAHNDVTEAEADARAIEMLRRVGIPAPEQRMREYPHQLSGGMRQRVMIAMALANDPALLIADEPTTALDVTIQAQILDLIRNLQRDSGMGTIMITHDLGVVAEIADKVAVMYAGIIVEAGPAERIFNDPQHPYTIGLMSSMPKMTGPSERLSTVPGTVPTIETMPKGCRFSTRCPFAQPICATPPSEQDFGQGHRVLCHFAPLNEKLERVQ